MRKKKSNRVLHDSREEKRREEKGDGKVEEERIRKTKIEGK